MAEIAVFFCIFSPIFYTNNGNNAFIMDYERLVLRNKSFAIIGSILKSFSGGKNLNNTQNFPEKCPKAQQSVPIRFYVDISHINKVNKRKHLLHYQNFRLRR